MTMSKPVARIVLGALIAVALIAATYMTVQGAFAKTEDAGKVQAHTVSGLKTNFNHDRSSPAELEFMRALDSYSAPSGGHGGGGCEHEMQISPLD